MPQIQWKNIRHGKKQKNKFYDEKKQSIKILKLMLELEDKDLIPNIATALYIFDILKTENEDYRRSKLKFEKWKLQNVWWKFFYSLDIAEENSSKITETQ